MGTSRSRCIHFFYFLHRLGVTSDWTLLHYQPLARTKLFALWAADLATGETLLHRSIKAATISKYLADAARFISGYTGSDPRMDPRSGHTIHPLIQGVLNELLRFETVPNKREPHTPAMQTWLRQTAGTSTLTADSLATAMADWCALGLVLGPRLSEWAQEDTFGDPATPKQAPNGRTWAFTWPDLEARTIGNRRVHLHDATLLPVTSIESFSITFAWQKNGQHGEKKLLVRNDMSPTFCPVRQLHSITQRFSRLMGSHNHTAPLAIYRDPSGPTRSITARDITSALRAAASHVYHIDPSTTQGASDLHLWTSHSLRIGA